MAGEIEQQELILRSRDGDLDAFNLLVEQYQGLVYNVAFRMLGNQGDAEDAAQESFVLAYRAIGNFRGGNFRSWILRITANACHDKMRSLRRSRITSLDNLIEESGDCIADKNAESPDEYAERQELARILNAGLSSLPEDQRLAVILSDVQGLSYEEVSEVMRSSLGTVKSRISRGRARLRDFLLEYRELLPYQFRLDK